ncbi:hypothetical protein ACT2FY_13015 [Paraburkholderia fungorum]|uniref:hypothetical protein n=1 Tax=Paraburkholderia fungorum TaxID=134537 RepID=UPI00402B5DCC
MSEIKIHTGRTNTQTHRAVLHADEIRQILADRVCEAACVSRNASEISVSVQLSSRMGNHSCEYEAIVTVTVDYEKLPAVAEESK